MVRSRDGVCISINLNFWAWHEVEIRSSDNPWLKEAIDDIILAQENKYVISRLGIIFSEARVAQLRVLKINFFCQRDNRSANSNFIPCQEVVKWQWLIVCIWHLVEISWEIAVYAYWNASNFKLEEPRCL